VHENIKVLCLNVIFHSYSLLYNNALPTAKIIRDRVGTMIVKGTYLGTFERDVRAQLKLISRKFTACTRTGEENKIKAEQKIRKRKNVRGKTEEKRSNKIFRFDVNRSVHHNIFL